MELKINLDEKNITETVEQLIAEHTVKNSMEQRRLVYGVRDGIDKAVQKYIYTNKDAIIDRVVERVSKHITKKVIDDHIASLLKGETKQ